MELKRCPFCGGKAYLAWDFNPYVHCKRCGIGTRSKPTEEEAIETWNRREG
jgi:Lar family restriction alleviation protein